MKYLQEQENKYSFVEGKDNADYCVIPVSEYDRLIETEKKSALVYQINKELINAKRGITPKKEHPGHILLRLQEKNYHCMVQRREAVWGEYYERTIGRCWEYVFQSPISIELGIEYGKKQIVDWIEQQFQVSQYQDTEERRSLQDTFFVTDTFLRVNPYNKLWEYSFTLPDLVMPTPEMFPPSNQSKNDK